MRRSLFLLPPLLLVLGGGSMLRAQRPSGDWMTSGFDAQRSHWVRGDGKISPATLRRNGFTLEWKYRFDNTPRQLQTTTPPALLDFYIGYRGFRSLGFFGASADKIIVLDIDLARTEWEKSLVSQAAPEGTILCPGGMTAAVTRPTSFAYPSAFFGRGAGRGTPAKSGVGEPFEGAVTLRGRASTPPAPRPAPPPPPGKKGAPAAADNPFSPRVQWILALSGDGKLHAMWVSNGNEPNPPIPFLPPNARAHGLLAVDDVVYAATSGSCGGVPNGVWALELRTKKVSQWQAPPGVDIAGSAGPAATPEGILFVAAGGTLYALEARTLAEKGKLSTDGSAFATSPLVFEHKGRNLVAAATADGRIHVADTAALGSGVLASSPPASAPGYAMGALASWQDDAGIRWILAPGPDAVTAWKLAEQGGKLAFERGWTSPKLVSALTPVIINGVVFVLSSGEFRSSDPSLSASERARRSTRATLYALDGVTGSELWNSGDTMQSFVSSGGLSAGGGRVYAATYDGTQYAFGFPIEH